MRQLFALLVEAETEGKEATAAMRPQARQAMAVTAVTASQEMVETVAEAATVRRAMVGTAARGVIVPPEKEEMEATVGTAGLAVAKAGEGVLAPRATETVGKMGELNEKCWKKQKNFRIDVNNTYAFYYFNRGRKRLKRTVSTTSPEVWRRRAIQTTSRQGRGRRNAPISGRETGERW